MKLKYELDFVRYNIEVNNKQYYFEIELDDLNKQYYCELYQRDKNYDRVLIDQFIFDDPRGAYNDITDLSYVMLSEVISKQNDVDFLGNTIYCK